MAALELNKSGGVRGRSASMPRILTLTLADIYTGLTFHGTPSPAHKSESGKREAAEQGSGLVFGV